MAVIELHFRVSNDVACCFPSPIVVYGHKSQGFHLPGPGAVGSSSLRGSIRPMHCTTTQGEDQSHLPTKSQSCLPMKSSFPKQVLVLYMCITTASCKYPGDIFPLCKYLVELLLFLEAFAVLRFARKFPSGDTIVRRFSYCQKPASLSVVGIHCSGIRSCSTDTGLVAPSSTLHQAELVTQAIFHSLLCLN